MYLSAADDWNGPGFILTQLSFKLATILIHHQSPHFPLQKHEEVSVAFLQSYFPPPCFYPYFVGYFTFCPWPFEPFSPAPKTQKDATRVVQSFTFCSPFSRSLFSPNPIKRCQVLFLFFLCTFFLSIFLLLFFFFFFSFLFLFFFFFLWPIEPFFSAPTSFCHPILWPLFATLPRPPFRHQ